MDRTYSKQGMKQHAGQNGALMPKPNQQAAAAYRQGKSAGKQGKLETDNPFNCTPRTGLAAWWAKGWQECRS